MLYDYQSTYADDQVPWRQVQFSQFGEDVALWSWLETLRLATPGGFYVDVGAHHPVRGSNTKLVRDLLGWTGINIEPDPKLFSEFQAACPNCVNLQLAIGAEAGVAELSVFNHPGVNTISPEQRDRQSSSVAFHVVDTVQVEVRVLRDVLREHLPSDCDYRLLTVDAEGLDLAIIQTANLDELRPKIIMIEDFDFAVANPQSPIFKFLVSMDYEPVSHCMVTTIYRDVRKS